MRYSRQNKIMDIINTYDVETQDQLVYLLKKAGFRVTQATISRDIKDLQLVKTLAPNGRYRYTPGIAKEQPALDRFTKIFKETLRSVNYSGNIIVIQTLAGCANAACEAIDTMDLPGVIGTIAGDNTIFLLVAEGTDIHDIVQRFNEMIQLR